ncbi:MAG: hypothetical protein ACI4NE_05205 [Succinivibrio sp.]
MAFRAIRNKNRANSKLRLWGKLAALFLIAVTAVAIVFILYFNGQNVKAPLVNYLSSRTGFTISIEKVEFSPLYPDVIKLNGITIGSTKIKELYAEYDLKSILSSDTLKLDYLYLKELVLNENDAQKLRDERFKFNSISIDKLDVCDSTVSIDSFKAKPATLSCREAKIDNNGEFTFKEGKLTAKNGYIDDFELKDLSTEIVYEADSIRLKNLHASVLGGYIAAEAKIEPQNRIIDFDKLSLNKLILIDPLKYTDDITISIKNASAQSLVVALPKQDLLIGQITGKLSNFYAHNSDVSFEFIGKAGEISSPTLQLTLDNSSIKTTLENQILHSSVKGNIFNGVLESDFSYDFSKDKQLDIQKIGFEGGRLEIKEDLLLGLYTRLKELNCKISLLEIDNSEVVSHIDSFPISVKSASGSATSLNFSNENDSSFFSGSKISLKTDSAYFSDLFIKNLELNLALNEGGFELKVPNLTFMQSSLSFELNRDYKNNLLTFKTATEDFNLAELNSGLIPRLVGGKLTFSADIKTAPKSPVLDSNDPPLQSGITREYLDRISLLTRLKGGADIKSKSVVVSNFGLDLLNGGPKKDYTFSFSDLASAIYSSDLGLYDLNTKISFDNGSVSLKGSSDLTTSHITLRGTVDLLDLENRIKATLVSMPKDSITSVILSGKISSPTIFITALTRGMERPGIEDPEGQKEDKKEESTNEDVATADDIKNKIDALKTVAPGTTVLDESGNTPKE